MGTPIKLPRRDCYQFFEENVLDISKLKECDDSLFVSLMRWKMHKKGLRKEKLFDKFIREYYSFNLEKTVYIENLKNGLVWDTVEQKSFGPSITETYLKLSKNKKLDERVNKRLSKLN